MMDNPVFKTGCRDQSFLGIVDIKAMVGPMMVSMMDQFLPQAENIVFQVHFKTCHIGFASFSRGGLVISGK
jgi:hypothetical protein